MSSALTQSIRKVAVLCPGPSLKAFPGRGDYAVLVGVNRAVGFVECDYWVMLDAISYELVEPIGDPIVVTAADQWREVRRIGSVAERAKKARTITPDCVNASLPRELTRWRTWSATTAIALAFHIGATWIDCYGMDWKGQADYDGHMHPNHGRDDSRWMRERIQYNDLRGVLKDRGATVRRIGSDGREVIDD